MRKWKVACLLVVLALAGCGADRVGEAANTVEPQLRSFWSRSYAGLEVDDDRLVVYRTPNPALDAFVRERAAGVEVEFRDSPYSLDQLQELTERVTGDGHYWSTRQFALKMVVPRADGTGVNAIVAAGDIDAARAEFRQRYGAEPVFVRPPARTGIAPI